MSQANLPGGPTSLRELSFRFWLATVITGVAAGVAGALLTLLLHLVQHISFGYIETSFLVGVEQASPVRRVVVMAIAGVIAGLGWWALRSRMGQGKSVTEAVWDGDGRVPLLRTALDGVLQIVVVAMGASLGREGAPRETGGALGSVISGWLRLPLEQRRLLVAAGSGAGLAAVYNVPIAGGVFTAEVMLGSAAIGVVVPALVTSVIATAVAWIVLPNTFTYQLPDIQVSASLLVAAVVIGPLAGLAAAGFVRLMTAARALQPRGWRLPLSTTVAFTAVGALAIPFPEVLGNGKGPAQISFDGTSPGWLLVVLLLLKPVATALCLGSGARGGLLTPALATGALLGAAVGAAWTLMWPGSSLTGYALIGAAALLAAALQAPLAAIVLVVELTGLGPSLLSPVLIAVLGAGLVSTVTGNRSIYSRD